MKMLSSVSHRWFVLLALLWFTSETLRAAEDPAPTAVVKVKSYRCDAKLRGRFGSGIVVSHGDKLYVVSSSHVPFHGGKSDGVCHELILPDDQRTSLELRAANVLNDLALFSIDEPPVWFRKRVEPVPYEKLNHPLPTRPEQVAIRGVAFNAQGPTFYPGILTNPFSSASTLTLVNVAEVQGLSEYGMSGGGVFSEDNALYGIISHQYLNVTDHGAVVANLDDEGLEGLMHTLAIPTSTVFTWLAEVFQGSAEANVRLDVKEQLAGRRVLYLGIYKFTETNCSGVVSLPDKDRAADSLMKKLLEPSDECVITVEQEQAPRRTVWPVWLRRNLGGANPIAPGKVYRINSLHFGANAVPAESLLSVLSYVQRGYVPALAVVPAWTKVATITVQGPVAGVYKQPLPHVMRIRKLTVGVPVECINMVNVKRTNAETSEPGVNTTLRYLGVKLEGNYAFYHHEYKRSDGYLIQSVSLEVEYRGTYRCVYTFWAR